MLKKLRKRLLKGQQKELNPDEIELGTYIGFWEWISPTEESINKFVIFVSCSRALPEENEIPQWDVYYQTVFYNPKTDHLETLRLSQYDLLITIGKR